MKKHSLKALALALALAFTFASHAQEQRSPVWLEGSASLSLINRIATHSGAPANLSIGYNRFYNEHASWGILWDLGMASRMVVGSGGQAIQSHVQLSLTPNLSLRYPINSFLAWTPRFYLSVGHLFTEQWATPTGGDSHYSEAQGIPIELGARLASFDLSLNPHCAFNINLDPLSAYLRLTPTLHPQEDPPPLLAPVEARLPFGQVYEDASSLARPLCTVSFRYRF